MDDNTLAAQYAQTGDLMDLCNTDAWLQESIQIEDEVSGQVEAGLAMQEYHHTVNALRTDQLQHLRQQMRVQSILLTGLRQWMDSWDLGAGFEDTYAIARRFIREHLANPTPTQQSLVERLWIENQDSSANPLKQQQVVAILSEMFTQENWQAMAKVASHSISSQVLSAGQTQTNPVVA
jgi:hypothetical protein